MGDLGFWKLAQLDPSHLAVVEHGSPVGLLSDRDLAAVERGGLDTAITPVERLMAPFPFTVSADARAEEVARMMASRPCDAAIVAEAGQVVGIIDAVTALRALAGLPPTSEKV